MTSDPIALTALAAWCFAVALAGGLAGLVLGNIRLPAVLAAASSPAAGAGANIGISGVAAAAASIAHVRAGRVNWRLFAWMAPPSVAGALVGGYVSGAVPDEALLVVIGLTLLYFGVDLLRSRREGSVQPKETLDIRAAVVSGAVIGLLGGLVGLILGSLRMPALLKSVGETAHRAVGTNLVVGVCVGGAGVIGHAPEGVDWELLALGGAASIPGAVIGARLTGRLSTDQLMRAIGGLLVVAGVGILISAASPSDARAAVSAPDLAGRIADPWPQRQSAAGSFDDYMAVRGAPSRDLYGHAMLGYGLLATGLQRNDRRLVDSGLRGLVYAVEHPRPFHSVVFEKLALAAGYNLARSRVEANPLFRAARPRWQARLRAMGPTWLGRARKPYFNQHLVDAVTVLELARSDVSSPGGRAGGLAADLVNRRLPRLLRGTTGAGTTMAADGALSYHALTVAFYARAIRLLGGGASPAARRLLDRLARASWALAGPDGDIGYFGRSQEQGWALALTAYGADAAAVANRGAWAPRYRALALKTLARLRDLHTGGPDGLYLTPAFREDRGSAIAAQEDYVSGSAYTGFTLLGLAWVGERVGPPGPIGILGADARSTRRLDRGRRQFAVRSAGPVWVAARRRGSTFELLALKVRDRRGRWRDVLLHGATAGHLPAARVSPRRPARADMKATRCGVRIAAPEAGGRWDLTAFLPTRPRPRRTGKRSVLGRDVSIRYGGAGHIVLGGRFRSSSRGPLVRVRLSARGRASFALGLANCR